MKKILMAEHTGFCFGVDRAVNLAYQAVDDSPGCYCLGQIIHNKSVSEELAEKGLIIASSAAKVPPGARVIIRSHGAPRSEIQQLKSKGAVVIDATCPRVSRIHKIAEKACAQGLSLIIIGKPEHPEVQAIQGWHSGGALVFSNARELEEWLLEDEANRSKPLIVVFQTTLAGKIRSECDNLIKNLCTKAEVFDTICDVTSTKQGEARKLSQYCDAVVVIGDKHSSNSANLAEICREYCDSVMFIEGVKELDCSVLSGADTVGIMTGASTPAWIIKEVKQKMCDEIKANEIPETEAEEMNVSQDVTEAVQEGTAFEENQAPGMETVGEEVPQEVAAEGSHAAPEEAPPEGEAVEALPGESDSDSQADEKSFAELLEDSIKTIYNGETVSGIVAAITPTEVTVDLGAKQSGYIPLSEFTDDPDVKVEDVIQIGSKIEASVVRVNDVEGTVMLSKKRLDVVRHWNDIETAQVEGTIVEGTVTEDNKGGVVVSVWGIRVFVPASQTGLGKDTPMSELVKQKVRLKITEVNRSRRRVVGSIRAVIFQERKERAEKIWSEIEIGKKYDGVVKSLTSYGAFVDIGGIDGMVHVSELSWSRIRQPSEVVSVGDEIEVYVINFDQENRRISLGYKDPDANPWLLFKNRYGVSDVVNVKIVKLMPFGAFAEVLPGVDGLIHISQIADRRIGKPDDVLIVGEFVDVKITNIDDEKQKISLSIRALQEAAPAPAPKEEVYSRPSQPMREDALVYEISATGEVTGLQPEEDPQ